jgi:hypothetical protein
MQLFLLVRVHADQLTLSALIQSIPEGLSPEWSIRSVMA